MQSLNLTKCSSCGSDYSKLLGKNLNKLTKGICPCCDSQKHEMIMDHLKEENSNHFNDLKKFQNILDEISDEEFTPELQEKILELVNFDDYKFQEEDIDLILNYEGNHFLKAA